MKPNLSGDYVLNRNASVLGPAASAITNARMRLTHDEPRLACSARFASKDDAMEFTFERFTDGRTMTSDNGDTSRCYWDGDTLVSEDRFGPAGAAVGMTWRYDLLGDGRQLRATEQIRGGGRDQDNVWSFERQ